MQCLVLQRHGVVAGTSRQGRGRMACPKLSKQQHRAQPGRRSRARGTVVSVLAFKNGDLTVLQPSGMQQDTATGQAAGLKRNLAVSWAGAGIFFFWQLGAMKLLAEKYDLTKVPMAGASGGALAAVLAACGVDADLVIEKAYQMSMEQRIWDKPKSLLGTWGAFIEKWLDELLPDNAHELCRGRITVVITTLPDWQQIGISDFTSKADLINACMASSHVPLVLNFKWSRKFRGRDCVDGSFPDFFTGLNSELLRTHKGGEAIVFDYFDDNQLTRRGRLDMLEVKSYDEIRTMYRLGYEYAEKLHTEGRFQQYELSSVELSGDRGHMSEVLTVHSDHHSTKESPDAGLVIELDASQAEAELHASQQREESGSQAQPQPSGTQQQAQPQSLAEPQAQPQALQQQAQPQTKPQAQQHEDRDRPDKQGAAWSAPGWSRAIIEVPGQIRRIIPGALRKVTKALQGSVSV